VEKKQVKCADCANKIILFGNKETIVCKISNMIEPMYELWICEDFEPIKIKSG
jgi:hypothetical protein